MKLLTTVKLIALAITLPLLSLACDSGSSGNPQNDPISGTPGGGLETPDVSFIVTEDELLRGYFYDPNMGDKVAHEQVTVLSLPEHGLLEFGQSRTDFVYTPEANFSGSDAFRYATTDNLEVLVRLAVQPVNDAPTLEPELPRVAAQGKPFVAQLLANDVDDNDVLVFSANNLPEWMHLERSTGLLTGTPSQNDIGFFSGVTFRVTDQTGAFDEFVGVDFEVIDVNDAPLLNVSAFPEFIAAGSSIEVPVFPDDPEGGSVILTIEPNEFVDTRVEGGTVHVTANDVLDVTEINLVIQATDASSTVRRQVVPLTLLPVSNSGNGLTLSGSRQGRGVHVVLLGDGYREEQLDDFREHADELIAAWKADSGISDHIGAFNIHIVPTASQDAGADDNDEVDGRATFFDAAYNCNGIVRLMCANELRIYEVALAEYPWLDQILLLVNDNRYGGSGNTSGNLAIYSAWYPEIALHELGHSFAGLADEYVDAQLQEYSEPADLQSGLLANVSSSNDAALVPWAHWLGEVAGTSPLGSIVDVYDGAYYRANGVYRGTLDSRMRSFGEPFGVINSEQWILSMYEETQGIRGLSPLDVQLVASAGETLNFAVSTFFDDNIQRIEWFVDGLPVEPSGERGTFSFVAPVGLHSVELQISDVSGKIRKPMPHAGVYQHRWELDIQ